MDNFRRQPSSGILVRLSSIRAGSPESGPLTGDAWTWRTAPTGSAFTLWRGSCSKTACHTVFASGDPALGRTTTALHAQVSQATCGHLANPLVRSHGQPLTGYSPSSLMSPWPGSFHGLPCARNARGHGRWEHQGRWSGSAASGVPGNGDAHVVRIRSYVPGASPQRGGTDRVPIGGRTRAYRTVRIPQVSARHPGEREEGSEAACQASSFPRDRA